MGIPAGWTQRTPGALGGVTGVAVPTLNGVLAYGEDADREAASGLLERVAAAGVPHCCSWPLGAAVSCVNSVKGVECAAMSTSR